MIFIVIKINLIKNHNNNDVIILGIINLRQELDISCRPCLDRACPLDQQANHPSTYPINKDPKPIS